LLTAAWLVLAFLDYTPRQSHEFPVSVRDTGNTAGWVINDLRPPQPNLAGVWAADIVWCGLWLFGVAAWWIPLFLVLCSALLFLRIRRHILIRAAAMALFVLAFACRWAMVEGFKPSDYFVNGPGGAIGRILYLGVLRKSVGFTISGLLVSVVIIASLVSLFLPWGVLFDMVRRHGRSETRG